MTCLTCNRTCPTPGCHRHSHGLCPTHYWRRRWWGDERPDIPIARAVHHTIVGCGTCGAGDVRPAPCQTWCWTQRFPAVRRRRRRKVAA